MHFAKIATAISTQLAKTVQFLPSSCALCGLHLSNKSARKSELMCTDCYEDFFTASVSRCSQCALPLLTQLPTQLTTPLPTSSDQIEQSTQTAAIEKTPLGGVRCGECIANPPSFDHTVVACNYVAPVDQLALALKFAHQLMLAPLLSDLLRDAIVQDAKGDLPDLLAAVPLGQQRLIERGFNQAVEIGKPLSRQLGIPFLPDLLERTRNTAQQSSLHPDERQKNVRNAFIPNELLIEQIYGKHIGIVDDVMTTGTTLHEIATVLKRFGARRISNYVFARTLPH